MEKLPQVLRGDFFDSHCMFTVFVFSVFMLSDYLTDNDAYNIEIKSRHTTHGFSEDLSVTDL